MAISSGLEKVEQLVAQLEDSLDGEDRKQAAQAILREALIARLPNQPEIHSMSDVAKFTRTDERNIAFQVR